MYVCICARVRECEVRTAIQCGARTEDAVGDACGAGTSCGSCLDRIEEAARGSDNLLYPLKEALAVYATIGECCDRLRRVFGEYRPSDIS